jgi:branched-chain amino acid aminotransferase
MTPAINGTFLNGVTRQRTIQLLREDGVEVVEGTLTMDDIWNADEIFASGNHAKIRPVTQFEDRELQPGPIARRAKDLYFEYAQGFSVF